MHRHARPAIRRTAGAAVALAALLLTWTVGPSTAQERPDLVIGGGKEGGNYQAMAGRLQILLGERGHQVESRASLGSIENLVDLENPTSSVGAVFAQADALNGYLEENPDFANRFVVLADVGKECVFLFARGDGPVRSAADLKAPGRKLSVDRPGSGATVTYDYLQRIEPDFRATEPVTLDVMEALAQMRAGEEYAQVDAAMIVHRPGIVSPALAIVLEDRDTFRFVPILPGDLRATSMPDGKPVYTFETVRLRDVSVKTLCTRALVIVNPAKVSPELRSDLSRILLESADSIAPSLE